MLSSKEMLLLSPWEFDQGPHGIDSLKGHPDEQVAMIRLYLDVYARGAKWLPTVPSDPEGMTVHPALLHWHLGQVIAMNIRPDSADVDVATDCMDVAARLHPDPRFCAYIRGTVAFLLRDEEDLKDAMAENPVNLHILERCLRRIDGSFHPYYLVLVDP